MKNTRVAHVLNEKQLVLNIGSDDGVKVGDRYLIYGFSEFSIIDPETGNSLGNLELVRGTGRVCYTQAQMSILDAESPLPTAFAALKASANNSNASFKSPEIGDFARQINNT